MKGSLPPTMASSVQVAPLLVDVEERVVEVPPEVVCRVDPSTGVRGINRGCDFCFGQGLRSWFTWTLVNVEGLDGADSWQRELWLPDAEPSRRPGEAQSRRDRRVLCDDSPRLDVGWKVCEGRQLFF